MDKGVLEDTKAVQCALWIGDSKIFFGSLQSLVKRISGRVFMNLRPFYLLIEVIVMNLI